CISRAARRPSRSAVPPGGNGTMNRMGRLGHASAETHAGSSTAMVTRSDVTKLRIRMASLPSVVSVTFFHDAFAGDNTLSIEYAPLGFVGLLTPQANTVAESELAILLPPGAGLLTGRLTSPRATIEERLLDYFESLEATSRQFAGVPLRALGFACTGSSYLAGRDREDEMLRRLSE